MLVQHNDLKLIDYSIVNFVPFEENPVNAITCTVLSYKLDKKVCSFYTPIHPKSKELVYVDLIEKNFGQQVFHNDSNFTIPEELEESRGVKSEDIIGLDPQLAIANEPTIIDSMKLHDYLFKQTKQLWQEYINKTLQMRTDLHDYEDLLIFGEIENYRIRNNLATTAAAMKELINNAILLEKLNVVIENDKLYKKEYL